MCTSGVGCPLWHWIPASCRKDGAFVILAGKRGSRLQGCMPPWVEALPGAGFRRPAGMTALSSSSQGSGDPGYRDVCHRRWKPSLALDSGVPAGKTARRHPRREAGIQVTGMYVTVGGSPPWRWIPASCRNDSTFVILAGKWRSRLQGCMPPWVEVLPGAGFRHPCQNDGSHGVELVDPLIQWRVRLCRLFFRADYRFANATWVAGGIGFLR